MQRGAVSPSLRVLHIQKVKGIAGSEKHLLTLVPALSRVGYQSEMLVLANNREEASSFVDRMRRSSVPAEVILMSGHLDFRVLFRLRKWIADRQYDLVHTHLFHADLYGTLAARLAGTPTIVSSKHGFGGWRRRGLFGFIERTTARLQKRIIVISRGIGDWLAENEKLPREKFEVVYYGLDRLSFIEEANGSAPPFRTDRVVIGTVGRLIEQKGISILIRAFNDVRKLYPDSYLVIAGAGPERDFLEALVNRLDLTGQVEFLGYRRDISALMEHFDLFVFPTYGEGFGLVLLEAMAWEKPIVASHTTSIPEIVIDRETGLLVPPGDPEALARAICVLLEDPQWRAAMGARGRLRLDRFFTVERMVEETARVYQDILREAHSA